MSPPGNVFIINIAQIRSRRSKRFNPPGPKNLTTNATWHPFDGSPNHQVDFALVPAGTSSDACLGEVNGTMLYWNSSLQSRYLHLGLGSAVETHGWIQDRSEHRVARARHNASGTLVRYDTDPLFRCPARPARPAFNTATSARGAGI